MATSMIEMPPNNAGNTSWITISGTASLWSGPHSPARVDGVGAQSARLDTVCYPDKPE